ncbi:hypothetical protein [Streptomyces sp. NPDC026092]|uniref:hypothetical protein n=1 Tax=Streptomyces sp. NPDC026092 TaxID=3154797 RepID=UPI0033D1EB2C
MSAGQMRVGEQSSRDSALAELHDRLGDALARQRLNKSQLAARAGLGRTTVSEAFRVVPSAETVAALAGPLRLPVDELLMLRRTAADDDGDGPSAGTWLGRPIEEWDPHALEVHPAGSAAGAQAMPSYVRRAHDQELAAAVREARHGISRMMVLVGSSSTGKTRACWEAVQPLAEVGWRLWHPFDPTRAAAAMEDLHQVEPRTVVWLNEAQHYFGDNRLGEEIAAAVHALLTQPERGPVLVLGTLWPEYARQYQNLPAAGGSDPHSRVRELLAGRTTTVPPNFDAEALRCAAGLARDGDRLLADALTRAAIHGQVTQDLAGAPQLLQAYDHGSPAARAVLEAAMDARRLGVGLYLPQSFLIDAALDYLAEADYDHLADDWAEAAFAELARPVHGRQAPLRRASPRPVRRPPGTPSSSSPSQTAGPAFRLSDYLEQHGRDTRMKLCPPVSFWAAAHAHLTHPEDLGNLADAAARRHRLQWAHHLWLGAAEAGSIAALSYVVRVREGAGDHQGAEELARRAARDGNPRALARLAELRKAAGDHQGAQDLDRQAADSGDVFALARLAELHEAAGDHLGAEAAARRGAAIGNTDGLARVAHLRRTNGDHKDAEPLYQQAVAAGDVEALFFLVELKEKAGDYRQAEAFALQAAEAGESLPLEHLVSIREWKGRHRDAEALAKRVVYTHTSEALFRLARLRERGGYNKSAERLYRQAASAGNARALAHWAWIRERRSRHGEDAESFVQQAADAGNPYAFYYLAHLRQEQDGDQKGADHLYNQAIIAGDDRALYPLVQMREEDEDHVGAEALADKALGHAYVLVLIELAAIRERAGHESADSIYRRIADAGIPFHDHEADNPFLDFNARWPHGLDPDGSPTPSWR